MNERVVVTGASGFIGGAVCRELVSRGITAYAAGRGRAPEVPDTQPLVVRDYSELRSNAEICIHLAGDRGAAAATGAATAEALAKAGFEHILFGSTALVYGDAATEPHTEAGPVNPTTNYARRKYEAEQVFLAAGYGVARIANVYGPGMSQINVFSDILRQLPGDADIEIRDTKPVRDYVHVDDVARALVTLATRRASGIFNVGSGTGISAGALAESFLALAGRPDRAVVAKGPIGGTSHLVLDVSKALAVVNWSAQIALEEGLAGLLRERDRTLP